ncbi:hypothetical protein BHAOGJBA_4161 [Methylobacterium hispanicum]|uniref:diguanylate cyclase n=1 Tax=Methylobacterium hispanicum TaxID=270350 RepID=A0AAV4ZQ14_9HYPH|nr:hypothetical protein BHAOGJBA_4161 [Methylobacterium hispanicum]
MQSEAPTASSRETKVTASLLLATRIVEFALGNDLVLDPQVFAAFHAYLGDPDGEAAAEVAVLVEAGCLSEKGLHEIAVRIAPPDARRRTQTVQQGVADSLAAITEGMDAHAAALDEDERIVGRIEQSLAALPSAKPGPLAGALRAIVSLHRQRLAAQRAAICEFGASLRAEQVRILELRRELEALRTETTLDGLTGLLNRRGLDAHLSAQNGTAFTLLMIDIDHFKSINDRFGHPAGDGIIKSVGAMLRHCVRERDFVARMGGEEFAVILPATGEGAADIVAARIRASVAARRFVKRHTGEPIGSVTVSIGGACGDGAVGGDVLMERADQALYASKRGGRDRVTFFADNAWNMAS